MCCVLILYFLPEFRKCYKLYGIIFNYCDDNKNIFITSISIHSFLVIYLNRLKL